MIIVRNRMRPRFPAVPIILAFALCAAAPLYASHHRIPTPQNAASYPSYDAHPAEHVVIAAVPYNTEKQGKLFRVHYLENGFLPIYLVVTNNGDTPLSLAQARIDLISAGGERIPAATPEDIERRMTRIDGMRAPIPLPAPLPPIRRKPKSPDKKIEADFNDFEYSAITVPPHSTRAGFLFYDIDGLGPSPLQGADLTLRDLRNSSGKELFFFEIPLNKYL